MLPIRRVVVLTGHLDSAKLVDAQRLDSKCWVVLYAGVRRAFLYRIVRTSLVLGWISILCFTFCFKLDSWNSVPNELCPVHQIIFKHKGQIAGQTSLEAEAHRSRYQLRCHNSSFWLVFTKACAKWVHVSVPPTLHLFEFDCRRIFQRRVIDANRHDGHPGSGRAAGCTPVQHGRWSVWHFL